MKYPICAIVFAIIIAGSRHQADASVAKLLRKGVETIARGSGKAARETAEAGTRRIGTQALPASGRRLSTQAVRRSGQVTVRAGASAQRVVLDQLGTGGSRALQRLTPVGRDQLADVAGELARSPYREQWLAALVRHGDACARFLWNRKGSIAVGTVAAAALLKPDDFLKVSGKVLETASEVAGRHLVEPLVTNTARHIAAPVALKVTQHAAEQFPWRAFWSLTGLSAMTAGGVWYLRRRLAM